jgi:hypothetical protein
MGAFCFSSRINSRIQDAWSSQARADMIMPSTTASESTPYAPAASSASSAWDSWATGFSCSKKCRMIRWQSWLLQIYSGARDHERHVVGGVDASKRQVGVSTVARLLRVGLAAQPEVVHHEVQLLLAGRSQVDLIAFLFQPLSVVASLTPDYALTFSSRSRKARRTTSMSACTSSAERP